MNTTTGGIHPAPAEFSAEELSTDPILRYFHYRHLPPALQRISQPACELAREMIEVLPMNGERTAGLRKLLEAKDCFVRANVPAASLGSQSHGDPRQGTLGLGQGPALPLAPGNFNGETVTIPQPDGRSTKTFRWYPNPAPRWLEIPIADAFDDDGRTEVRETGRDRSEEPLPFAGDGPQYDRRA